MQRLKPIAALSRYIRRGSISPSASSSVLTHQPPSRPSLKHGFFIRTLIQIQTAPSELVRVEKLPDNDSGIVEVKLERAEAKNAISKELLRGLRDALDLVNSDSSVNVVLISSSVPGVFCAGADLKERRLMSASEVHQFVNSLRSTFTCLELLPIPTIAVVEGAALGGGMELALSCDLRICGDSATFGLPETALAIIPGAGGTQRLPRIVGKSIAKELIYTGRRVKANEAFSLGLVNHCVSAGDAHQKALEVAREINTKGPLALRMAKRAINEGMEVKLCSAWKVEEECYNKLLDTKDRLEGLAAFAEKRLPRYKGE